MSAMPKEEVTKEFLEDALKQEIESFEIEAGSEIGDNFMGIMKNIKCIFKTPSQKFENKKELNIAVKFPPSHPTRQDFLKKTNVFYKEMGFYEYWVPTLQHLVDSRASHPNNLELPVPPYFSGKAVDFLYSSDDLKQGKDSALEPSENYIMMMDLRKELGFMMADKKTGLRIEEMTIVMQNLATIHALGWCYKQVNNVEDINDEFPYLRWKLGEEELETYGKMIDSNLETALNYVKKSRGKEDDLYEAIKKKYQHDKTLELVESIYTEKNCTKIIDFMNSPLSKNSWDDISSWTTVLHGDCWINNMLFKYDGHKKAIESKFVDFQLCFEACPAIDMNYLIYSSTTREFRAKYLDQVLISYHARFSDVCKQLGVQPFKNFTIVRLREAFQLYKSFGFIIAVTVLPIILREKSTLTDLEEMEHGVDLSDMILVGKEKDFEINDVLYKRLIDLCEEMYEEGVL